MEKFRLHNKVLRIPPQFQNALTYSCLTLAKLFVHVYIKSGDQKLSGSAYVFDLTTPGLIPKHTIVTLNFYLNCVVKRTKVSKKVPGLAL